MTFLLKILEMFPFVFSISFFTSFLSLFKFSVFFLPSTHYFVPSYHHTFFHVQIFPCSTTIFFNIGILPYCAVPFFFLLINFFFKEKRRGNHFFSGLKRTFFAAGRSRKNLHTYRQRMVGLGGSSCSFQS